VLFLCLKFPVAHSWRTSKKTPATIANIQAQKSRYL